MGNSRIFKRYKKIMNNLNKKIEDSLSAVSFAEAGEFETAREFLKRRQKVLLVLTGKESTNRNSYRYALNVCKRIDAELEILCIGENNNMFDYFLRQIQDELKRDILDYKVIKKNGNLKKEVLDYIDERGDVQFVVIGSDGLDIKCSKDERLPSHGWERLKCPLVVVSDLLTA